ncbi:MULTISPECIES: PepSY domain-containing protein [unclassified Phenylobacterium]|uniref:PepSY domain-containing protein n=1 Tax=unclassified Phenylobacterium TaxID=2640670 RepID=UPI00083B277A|nr:MULTISPECIES: PepSY domain-containing protein [unclassified Phenylobacterium]
MKRLFALAVLAATVTTPVVAEARDRGLMVLTGGGQDQARRQVPLSRVLSMLASRYPGRHLNSTMGDAGGRPAYYVQWQMENGRVVVFVVDAESGQVIGRQGG